MSLLETSIEDFKNAQSDRIHSEIRHWHEFKRDNPTGVYLAFSEQHREGRVHTSGNRLPKEREEAVRDYLTLPDVIEVDGIWVDATALQIPYNCMWKSCRLTGHYCCKVTSCTGNTDESASVMREAGRHFIDWYSDPKRIAAIRRGDTHTATLQHNRKIDGYCVFGEEEVSPGGEVSIDCRLHEAAYDHDIPLHHLHSIGPSLFPMDILIVDGQWFLTAAHRRAKDKKVTRWHVTSDDTICTNHGDSSGMGILQHPDFGAMFADILGQETLDFIQLEIYGEANEFEPEITDGWIHADERGLTEHKDTCRYCEGAGCDHCDGRGYFINWT